MSDTVLSEHFLPTSVFYFALLPHIFATTCFYQGLPGSRQFFLEVFRASCWSSKNKLVPAVCLIHSNPQLWYSEEFVLRAYQMLLWIACSKKFNSSGPYFFQTLFACSNWYVKTISKNWYVKTCLKIYIIFQGLWKHLWWLLSQKRYMSPG